MRSIKVASIDSVDTCSIEKLEIAQKSNEDFYNAIVEDDDIALQDILRADNNAQGGGLVNRKFRFPDITTACSKTEKKLKMTIFHLPLCVAGAKGSPKALKILLEHNCDVYLRDSNGSNILHALVWGSVLNKRGSDTKLLDLVLLKLGTAAIKDLMLMVDDNCLLPLELACVCQQFKLFHRLVSVDNVTRFVRSSHGVYSHVLYDVTDYETGIGRNAMFHPLGLLTEMFDQSLFNDVESRKVLESQVVLEWKDCKCRSLRGMAAIWLFTSLLFHVAIFLLFPYNPSQTSIPNASYSSNDTLVDHNNFYTIYHWVLSGFILAYSIPFSLLMILTGVFFVAKFRKEFNKLEAVFDVGKALNGNGSPVVDSNAQGLLYFALCLQVFICIFNVCTNTEFIRFIYATLYITNIGGMTFVFQSVPIIAHYCIIFRRLLYDLAKFMLFYTFIYSGLTKMLYSLMLLDPAENIFVTPFSSFYDIFLLTANLLDVSELKAKSVFVMPWLHAFVVLVLAYVLMNFMISILSHTVGIAMRHINHLNTLYTLRTVLIVETMANRICPGFLLSRKRKCFLTENGRMYVSCYEVKD